MSDFKGCPTSGKIIYNDIVLALKELNAVYDSIYIYIYENFIHETHDELSGSMLYDNYKITEIK